MNLDIALNLGRFITLLLIQVMVLNHVDFLGYLDPYLYIIFILLFPLNANRSLFLLLSFIYGLILDMFGDSGGIHAAACVTIAFARPLILRSTFGVSYEFQTIKLANVSFLQQLVYVSLMVIIHHFVLFSLEIFNLSHILLFAKKALFTSVFTIILSMLVLVLFRRKNS
ncbi:rod shape-determining protein MreD [Aquimarina rhabdastrellae]